MSKYSPRKPKKRLGTIALTTLPLVAQNQYFPDILWKKAVSHANISNMWETATVNHLHHHHRLTDCTFQPRNQSVTFKVQLYETDNNNWGKSLCPGANSPTTLAFQISVQTDLSSLGLSALPLQGPQAQQGVAFICQSISEVRISTSTKLFQKHQQWLTWAVSYSSKPFPPHWVHAT